MDDLDVRSALTEYVTEAEPPIGLTEEGILAAGRRSRRRRLSAGIAGAALAVVAALGVTFAIVAPQRDEPVAGDRCGTKSSGETAQQVIARLSCAVGTAVRSRLASGMRIERITLPGEIPPADPFQVYSTRLDEVSGAPTFYYLGVRVSDDRGTGSVYLRIYAALGYGMASCEAKNFPKADSCSSRRIAEGTLRELTSRTGEGLIVRTTMLSTPTTTITLISNNSGVMDYGDGARLPAQSAEPPLSGPQLQDIATTPGLVP
ncbi:hypothetical protein [Amycolatopsis sp. NPDC051071]|uniref:hypothetical protein n=1 Tax=Amycolatopsis sp. NPDC051071 TaxID=3154637 RepID=UPI003420591D